MKEQKTTILGLRVRYLETEPREDRGKAQATLIILHGWGSSLTSWREVAQGLEEGGQKVFVPDLPGFGESEEPLVAWGLADYVNFVESFKNAVHIPAIILAGHSFGGQIAIAFAAQHMDSLRKLILISAARIVKRKKLKVRIFLFATKVGNLIFSLPLLASLRPLVQRIWYKLSGERDYYRASPRMQEILKRVLWEEVGSRLEGIRIPTLILWGDRDDLTPLADARIIHNKIAGSQLDIFPGGTHDLNLKKPLEVGEKIGEFMKQL